jgi:predicted kinase
VTALIITRGLPGSGKTTCARAWVAGDRAHRVRVNRDDLRAMLDDGEFEKGVTEPRILAVRDAAILGALARGLDVICDDTNLPQRTARDLARLAKRAAAGFYVYDYTNVPLETCLERNASRTDKTPVPEAAVRGMHARYLAGRTYPLPLPEEPADGPDGTVPYEPKPGTPRAVLVDIDGTVALKGARSPFDETRVHEDRPNEPVVQVVRALIAAGLEIRYVSGRTEQCRDSTVAWLREHVISSTLPSDLFMRAAGDMRKDSIVKRELFDRHIRGTYDVACVLDDRDQVVRMWRGELGLTCLQVAEGNF